MSVQIQPLSGVGAEILGVDLSGELTSDEFAGVRKAFAEYGLVFFRDQKITEAQHIAFAQRWAPININRFFARHPRYPQIALVTKERDQLQNIGGGWHTDHSYNKVPAMGSILVARELPPAGGDTLFASMYAAYDALSPGFQQALSGLRAVHSARHVFGASAAVYAQEGDRIGNPEAADTLEDAVHPVVITHPLSSRKALYVNPAFTVRFENWTAEESAPLLRQLYAHCMHPAFAHTFSWRPGSIAFWDNRATWHFAKNDYHGHRREMHRITLEGENLTA